MSLRQTSNTSCVALYQLPTQRCKLMKEVHYVFVIVEHYILCHIMQVYIYQLYIDCIDGDFT